MYCLWPFSGVVRSLLLCVLTIVDYVRHYFNMPGSNRLIFGGGSNASLLFVYISYSPWSTIAQPFERVPLLKL